MLVGVGVFIRSLGGKKGWEMAAGSSADSHTG